MLNSRDLTDRQIIAAADEYFELHKKRHASVIKRDRPVKRGWRRFYVLTEAAKRRRDRTTLEAILKLIGTEVITRSRSFRKRLGRSHKMVEIEQPLRPIARHEWPQESYPDEWHPYFHLELLLEWNRHWQPYWVFKQPSLFELKIQRNLLWHFIEVDPAIEKRLSEIDRWMESRAGWTRYGWLKGCQQNYRWEYQLEAKTKILRRVQEREIEHAFRDFPEVDLTSLAQWFQINLWNCLPKFPLPAPVAQGRGSGFKLRPVPVQRCAR